MDDKKLLEMYPVKECEFDVENDLVIIKYINLTPSFIERIFFKKQTQRPARVDLDKLGTAVWHLCDGKNSVNSIVAKLKEQSGEELEQAEQRTIQFIKQLAGNKFITLYQKNN